MNQVIQIEAIPIKAQFRPNEAMAITISGKGNFQGASLHCQWVVKELDESLQQGEAVLALQEDGAFSQQVQLTMPVKRSGAYGFFAEIWHEHEKIATVETAFDVAEHWSEAPRYGFLSDFTSEDSQDDRDIAFLQKHHINAVQFYDWMYRHDELIPADGRQTYDDPMGKTSSLQTIREKIDGLSQHGIASMAYAAVYASLQDYLEKHPEQGLYHNQQKPYHVGPFYIMDITPESDWTKHLCDELIKVLEFGFDGIHLDQYGFPKRAIRQNGDRKEVVALKDLYPAFIDHVRAVLREEKPDMHMAFNNVSDYPTYTTAKSDLDITYIEIWDPVTRLEHVKRVVDKARDWSCKQVVLAAYFPALNRKSEVPREEAEIGARVTMATIFASGGYHLLLGEEEKVLTAPYFPDYGEISDAFKRDLARYYDFIVMYRELLYDLSLEDISMAYTGGINQEVKFLREGVTFSPNEQIDTVWTILKEKPGYMVIHCINLKGLDNDVWHAGKKREPESITNIEIRAELLEQIEGIYWTSPDESSIKPQQLDYDYVEKEDGQGVYVRFTLPRLKYWSMVYVKMKAGIPLK